MKVTVVKAFGPYSAGATIADMPGNQARTMIARGMVQEAAQPVPSVVGGAPVVSPADRMMRPDPAQPRRKVTR